MELLMFSILYPPIYLAVRNVALLIFPEFR